MQEVLRAKSLRHQQFDRLAEQLLAPIFEHLLGLRVDQFDASLGIHDHHRVGHGIGQGLESVDDGTIGLRQIE